MLCLGFTLAIVAATYGADIYTPVPLTAGSFNADVVVESTGPQPIENFVTACPDGGTNLTGNVWFEQGWYPGIPVPGVLPAWGLPPHGTVFTAQYIDANNQTVMDTNHVYIMPPDYTTNNALFVSKNNGPIAATITINNPAPYAALSLFNSSGNGPVSAQYWINHQDGTTELGTFSSADWWHGSGSAPFPAWMAHCLMSVEGGNLQQIGGNNGDVYFNDITLTNTTSPVTSITFSNAGTGGRMNLFAISGSTDGVVYTNLLSLSGFNADMIIESNAPNYSINIAPCTATMERGTNLWGKVYFEKGFGGQNNFGMPPAGTTFTNAGGDHAFTLAPSYSAPNALVVCSNGWGPPNGTFTVSSPAAYTAISLLCGATWGPKSVDVIVHHQGAPSETFTGVSIPDWWNTAGTISGTYPATLSLITAAGFEVDNTSFDTGNTSRYRLFAVDIALADTTDPVTSVEIAYNNTLNAGNSPSGVIFFFGLGGSSNPTAPYFMFLPVHVNGYNADMVVEKTAVLHPLGIYSATTASMDGGTNNTGNTWYEQGYYKNFPLTGLPQAGSMVHSIAQSNSYQMPSTYAANNAAYIDASHVTANLTPVEPAIFTALSFLSSDANGRVTNQVVMQYADGTQETNGFISQDWFNNTPYAFSSFGRLNLDSASINNDPGHSGTPNPRLYEAQVGLNNVSSPLTNVVLNFLGAQNATSGRMVVMAMSAANSTYPVIIRSAAQNIGTGIEGTNLVMWCTTAGGAQPITYNWQIQSNGVWVNLTDGVGGVSGSSTLTNTIATNPGWLTNVGSPVNGAFSTRLQAVNAAGTVFGPTLNFTLFSGYPDLTVPSTPVSTFGGTTGDAGPPGNIDDLVGGNPDCKCLWHSPTANPVNVGFVATPGVSIARSIRLYWANDTDGRDPASVMLEGSNDGGTTWFTILAQTSYTHNTTRNNQNPSQAPNPLTQAVQQIDFYSNNNSYSTYRVTFPTAQTPSLGLVQIGEIEILGINVAPPTLSVQPPANLTVFAGASPTFTVSAAGASPLQYQWYSNNVAIPGANNPSFTLAHATLSNSGNHFYCVVQNGYGSATSTTVTLTVVPAPTQAYPASVLADHPMSYYRLDETDDGTGNNGKVANDYIGGFFGTYSNTILSVPGYNTNVDTDTASLFGQVSTANSMVNDIGLSFAAPAGANAAFSIEVWVQANAAQTVDAGIVTIGYGGFEQFNLDCGGSDPAHNFRFYVRDASGNTHGPSGTKSPNDLMWHHLVGVCDEAHSNVVLYVDGIQNGISSGFNSGLGILSPTTPMSIGSRRENTTSDYNLQFPGTIDEVAIYGYALNSNQVLAHYYAAHPAPVFTIQPTNTTVGEGAMLHMYSSAYGPGTITYQWYDSNDGGSTWTTVGGQTSPILTIPNVPASMNGELFQVVASNAYGSTTNSVLGQPGATLTVISGPPILGTDVPVSQSAFAGMTITLQVVAYGTPPLVYQWQSSADGGATWANLNDNGRITGSTTPALTIGNLRLSDGLSYRVAITNNFSGGSPTYSTADAVTVLPYGAFNNNGTNWTIQGTGTANVPPQPRIVNNVLTLTDNGQSENGSAFLDAAVVVSTPFQASFTYQVVGGFAGAQADGACFVLQNDPRGPTALGGGGGGLGVSGIAPSAELELNIYPGNPLGGEGLAFNINGGIGNYGGQNNLPTAPVVLDTGDHINVIVRYVNNIIHATLTDAETQASFSADFNLNTLGTDLPTILGGNSAYAGFTGADGGVASFQQVSNYRFVSLPSLSVHQGAGNTVVLSWPEVVGGFILQSKADLQMGTWANVNVPVNVVGGVNQVTVPASGNAYYRLALP